MGTKSVVMLNLKNTLLPFLFENTIVVTGVVLKTTGCEKGKKHCGQCGYLYWAISNDNILFILDQFKPYWGVQISIRSHGQKILNLSFIFLFNKTR